MHFIPVGNISHDSARDMADVFFARMLQHNDHVLWLSRTSKPDLGGVQFENMNDIVAHSAETLRMIMRTPFVSQVRIAESVLSWMCSTWQ